LNFFIFTRARVRVRVKNSSEAPFEVEANDLSLQIASLAMTMVEPDGSAALIARVDLGAAD
jgi:hypothetical protein